MKRANLSARLLGAGLVLASLGCSRARPDVGTLPRVEVPIEAKPEQDPTLFQDEQPPEPNVSRDPPDPKPLRMRQQIYYEVEFHKGAVRVLSVRSLTLADAQSTPRRTGRFAFELWAGAELIERVRFDFPLLAASSAEDEDALEAGLISQVSVRVPATASAMTARILDRKTRKALVVPWPPDTDPSEDSTGATSTGSEAIDPAPCSATADHCEEEANGGD